MSKCKGQETRNEEGTNADSAGSKNDANEHFPFGHDEFEEAEDPNEDPD